MKIFKGWRTRAVALAHIALGALMTIDPHMLQLISSAIPAERRYGAVLAGQGVLIWALRQITTTPPGQKI